MRLDKDKITALSHDLSELVSDGQYNTGEVITAFLTVIYAGAQSESDLEAMDTWVHHISGQVKRAYEVIFEGEANAKHN